jgi:transposase
LHEKLLDCSAAADAESPDTVEKPGNTASLDTVEEAESTENTDIQKVDINSIIYEDSRTFGGEWLSKQMFDNCGLSGYLSQNMDNEEIGKRIEIEIISRMIHPSSELETSRWIAGESSLCEMLSLPKVPNHRKLYEAARALYRHKDGVEDFLYHHFSSKHPDRMRLCLYDLSNFYFEGRKENSTLAKFGRSKEKRRDAKLISLALLSNGQGFIRRSRFYAGNISEPSTLQEVVSSLEADSKKDVDLFASKPVAVMDAGIDTEANLAWLRGKGFDYICVSRSGLQDYSLAENGCKTVYDNRNHPIELCIATPEGKPDDDMYLYVKSGLKQQKEESMSNKLTKRFVQEIENIRSSLSKKRNVKEEGGRQSADRQVAAKISVCEQVIHNRTESG